jgi:kumamolisin
MDPRSLPVPRPGEPGGIDPRALASYYSYPRQYDGAGTSIALVCLYGGYRRSDLETYFAAAGQPVPDIEDVAVGGARNDPAGDPDANVEITRDLEILGSVAPGARLVAYFAGNHEQGITDGLAQAIFDAERENSVVCLTWCIPESQAGGMLEPAVASLIEDAAAMGKTVCAPSGSSAPGEEPYFPGTSPYVLSCGATVAVPAGSGFAEAPAATGDRPAASRLYQRPGWQAHAAGRAGGRTSGRLIPDVSCLAGGALGYRCYANGGWFSVAGPGAAACMWAGLLARFNQALGRPWGMTSDLYTVLGPAGALAPAGGTAEAARPGWDAGTGWGTPDGERLLAVLQNPRRGRPGRRGR